MPKPIAKRYDYQSHENRNSRKRDDALSERCVKEAINLFNQQKHLEAWNKMAEAVTAGGVNAKLEFGKRAISLMESTSDSKMMSICKKVFGDAMETKIVPDLLRDAMQEKQAIAFHLMGKWHAHFAKDAEPNARESIECFKKAIELGHYKSNSDLGYLYISLGDYKSAIRYLEIEYPEKHGRDYWALYNIYNHIEGLFDKSKALKCVKIACDKNILEARVALPELLLRGNPSVENRNEALKILQSNLNSIHHFHPLLKGKNYKCLGDYYLKEANGEQNALKFYRMMLETQIPSLQIEYAKKVLIEKIWGNNLIPHAIDLMKDLLRTELAIEAYYILGMYYLTDPENVKVGREYVEKASAMGHFKAKVNLANFYEGNEQFPRNLEKSYAYILEANRIKEIQDLIIWKGVCLEEGRGVEKNLDLALEEYKKARLQGCLGGIFGEYALCLKMGKEKEAAVLKVMLERKLSVLLGSSVTLETLHPDQMTIELFNVQSIHLLAKYFESRNEIEKSICLYLKIAKHSMYAQFRVGELLWFGTRTKKDIPHAVMCFKNARVYEPLADVYLEQYYENHHPEMQGHALLTQNVDYYKSAADLGMPLGMEALIRLNRLDLLQPELLRNVLDEGRAQSFSASALEKAYKYYKENNIAIHERIFQFSLTREDPWALLIQGERFELNENHNEQNLAQAREMYQKAADKQHPLAFYLLGILDIIKAPIQAFESFKRGAELGSPESAFMLGHCYKDQKNAAEAVRWYKFAAERGHREAQFVFAGHLRTGNGIEQDLGLAKQYYEKAAQQAHPRAAEALQMIASAASF